MQNFNQKIERSKEIIRDAISKHQKIAIACSFGKDSMVLLHLALQVNPNIPVFSVMASTEFQDTYDFAEKVAKEWNLNYKEHRFDQPENAGVDCCAVPKVQKFAEILSDYDAWFSAIRKDEGATRADTSIEVKPDRFGKIKVNPIVDFTEKDVWRYVALYQIPSNPKYKEGYRSLGCRYCSTKEVDENETERAGRWRGTNKSGGECGIHSHN